MVDIHKSLELAEKLKDYSAELFHLKNYFYNVEIIRDDGKLEFNPVIAEDENCLTTLLAFVLNKVPVVIEGMSGSGKTRIIEAVQNLIPASKVLEMKLGSEKSAWYQADKINKSTYVIVPELQKATGDIEEILKDWGENRKAEYTVTDITMSKENDQTRPKILDPKPFLSSRALENKKAEIGAELGRRVIRLRTNSAIEQTKKILKYKLKLKSRPTDMMRTLEINNIILLKIHIESCVDLPDYEIKNPAAPALEKYIPNLFRISSSHIEYFFCVVDAITKFYHKDRITYTYKNKDGTESFILLSAPEDVFHAWSIYGRTFLELCLNMPELGRPILSIFPAVNKNQKLDNYSEPLIEETRSIKQIVQSVKEKQGIMLKKDDATVQVVKLLMTGFLNEFINTEKKNDVKRYYITSMSNLILTEDPLDWHSIIAVCKKNVRATYPEIAEEYISRFCGEKIIVKHAISGSKLNIYDGEILEKGEFENDKTEKESPEIGRPARSENKQIIESLLAESMD